MRSHTWILGALALALAACGGKDETVDSGAEPGPTTTPTGAASGTPTETETAYVPCTVTLSPSADDQAAVQTAFIEAQPGDAICFAAGTFVFNNELSLAVEGVTLRGDGVTTTILDWADEALGANGINITADGVTVEKLSVQDTPGDGIRATAVADITFQDMSVIWNADQSLENGAYGLYPVGCDRVRIERVLVKGARDAGIYVGQSTNILVAESEAWGNVAGIEIENSTDSEVRDNWAHDNTAGILVFNLPNLPVLDGKRAKVHHNIVENNNIPNFASPGTVVADVPAGSGMFVIASDNNEFHDNTIVGNNTVGLLIIGYSQIVFGPLEDPNYDIWSEGNWSHDNVFTDNGAAPEGLLADYIPPRPVPDIVFDGCENASKDNSDGSLTNCVSNNGAATYYDVDLCGLFLNQSSDLAPVTCEHEPLPAVNP